MIVVSDTSAITNLIQINQLDLLRKIFLEIIIPPAVAIELNEIPLQKTLIDKLNWIRIIPIKNSSIINEMKKILDDGESESIALALELNADYLLIDEIKGRKIVDEKRIRIIGLIGVLIKAKELKHITSVKEILLELRDKAGFRISDKLFNKILIIMNE